MMDDNDELGLSLSAADLENTEDFFPETVEESDLDACSNFSYTIICQQQHAKRQREEAEEHEEYERVSSEVKRLKRMNCLLKSSMQCVNKRIEAAQAERQCLQKMARALHFYKRHMALNAERHSFQIDSRWKCSASNPVDEFLNLEAEPDTQQDLQSASEGSVQQDQSAFTPANTGASELPARLEEDSELAEFAAVAAAALAVNKGRPAAALLDLLLLADKRKAM